MSKFPSNLKYTKDHEWAKIEDNKVRVGITSYAVHQLGDVTLIDLVQPATKLQANDRFGDVESVKTVSELFAPCAGEIVDINAALESEPELVNQDPYEKGWMVVIAAADLASLSELMDAAAYESYVGTLD